jgi:hypothetical protein
MPSRDGEVAAMKVSNILLWVALGCSTGCAPIVYPYEGVGAHTLKVAPDQEADVVWVQRIDPVSKRATQSEGRLMGDGQRG